MKRNMKFFGAGLCALLSCCGGDSDNGRSVSVQLPDASPAPPTPSSTNASSIYPNVIFIVVDDLNLYIQGSNAHPQAYTPNLLRLQSRGVTFSQAQANGAICSPSRASFLSGYLPSTTGKHYANLDFRSIPLLSQAKLFPEHFRDAGYAVYGAGKLFHDSEADNTVFGTKDLSTQPKSRSGTEGGYVGPVSSFGPYPWDGITREWGQPSRNIAFGQEGADWEYAKDGSIKLLNSGRYNTNPLLPESIQGWDFGYGRLSQPAVYKDYMNSRYPKGYNYSGWADFVNRSTFRYVNNIDRAKTTDEIITDWAVALLRNRPQPDVAYSATAPISRRPFLMMLGLTKTHPAHYIPDEYLDEVIKQNKIASIDDVLLPTALSGTVYGNDIDDVARSLLPNYNLAGYKNVLNGGALGGKIPDLVNPGQYIVNTPERQLKSMILAYLGAVFEVDVQLGKILDALDADASVGSNTIIIFTSDQGLHFGEKSSWSKGTLWNETFHVPLVIVDPRQKYNASRGRQSTIPVSLVDIYPTLLALTGVGQPSMVSGSPPLDGQSLLPAIIDPINPEMLRRPAALSSTWGGSPDSNIRTPASHNYSLRAEKWRYILGNNGEEELYNEEEDPFERKNIARDPAYAPVKAELKQLVKRTAGF